MLSGSGYQDIKFWVPEFRNQGSALRGLRDLDLVEFIGFLQVTVPDRQNHVPHSHARGRIRRRFFIHLHATYTSKRDT